MVCTKILFFFEIHHKMFVTRLIIDAQICQHWLSRENFWGAEKWYISLSSLPQCRRRRYYNVVVIVVVVVIIFTATNFQVELPSGEKHLLMTWSRTANIEQLYYEFQTLSTLRTLHYIALHYITYITLHLKICHAWRRWKHVDGWTSWFFMETLHFSIILLFFRINWNINYLHISLVSLVSLVNSASPRLKFIIIIVVVIMITIITIVFVVVVVIHQPMLRMSGI